MISVDRNTGEFKFQANKQFTENVDKILKPEKLFGKELEKEIKVGDSIEICPGALTITQEIMSLIEVSRGSALIIDYGEDHAFSNSFRVTFFYIDRFSQGIKDHKLVKEFDKIIEEVGQIDLTSYVNFSQIKKIAEANAQSNLVFLLFYSSSKWSDASGIVFRMHGHNYET